MNLNELETVMATAFPIFRKYSPNPLVVLSSGPAPISLQDFLFSAMSEVDRNALKAAGWKTNGFIAWYYQPASNEDSHAAPRTMRATH
jgi:hypothetical protein